MRIPYREILQRWYSALHKQHFSIDFVNPHSELAGYRLVVAPSLYLLDDDAASNLSRYVSKGGHLLVTAYSDVVDENDAFREGGFLVALRKTLGVWLEEFGALATPDRGTTGQSAGDSSTAFSSGGPGETEAPFAWDGGGAVGHYLGEQIHPITANVLARFTAGRFTGSPALTSNTHGNGQAYYLATIPDDLGMEAVLTVVTGLAGATPEIEHESRWLEACVRGDVLTVINHGQESVRVESSFDGVIELAPFEWRMIPRPSTAVHRPR